MLIVDYHRDTPNVCVVISDICIVIMGLTFEKGFLSKELSIRNTLYTGRLLLRGLTLGKGLTIHTIQYIIIYFIIARLLEDISIDIEIISH